MKLPDHWEMPKARYWILTAKELPTKIRTQYFMYYFGRGGVDFLIRPKLVKDETKMYIIDTDKIDEMLNLENNPYSLI